MNTSAQGDLASSLISENFIKALYDTEEENYLCNLNSNKYVKFI